MKVNVNACRSVTVVLLTTISLCVIGTAASAQKTIGTPGSPGATTTIKGDKLPARPQKFDGKIEKTAEQSKPYWPARIVPPAGAPNILLIITDDSGYGVPSTFGGVIPTPALDRIAANGLRYTTSTPRRCARRRARRSSPAAIITRSATASSQSKLPGIPATTASLRKTRRRSVGSSKTTAIATAWFGKNHNTPEYQASQAGPFDQWPTGMGFEYFYGFMGGDTNQWEPGNLVRNTTPIYPYEGKKDWNLTTAMADDAIAYMNRMNALSPETPFLIKYAPGGTHAPHHPTPEWIEKISDMHLFDQGWNELREQIYANQKKLGVIPPDAKLTPWPSDLIKEWDQLSADEKKLFLRQARSLPPTSPIPTTRSVV